MANEQAPWSQSDAEKAAKEHALMESDNYANAFEGFLAGVAWAAEMIEKNGTTMYGSHIGDPINRYWENKRGSCDTHVGKLVGIKPIEKEINNQKGSE